jgi:membrane-bound lytic murein transglycosylase D
MLKLDLCAPLGAVHRILFCLVLAFCPLFPSELQAQILSHDFKMDSCELQLAMKLNGANIQHLRCPESAPRDIRLTDTFSIPTALYPRVRFWHQVFAQFSVKDYAIHVSDHPYLVLEVVNFPWLDANGNPDRKASRLLQQRHQYYKGLLKRMDQGKVMASERNEAERLRSLFSQIPGKVRLAGLDLRNQKGQREFMHRGIGMSDPYLKHVEQEFANLSLPPELALLAFVESTFNLKAVSKVKASGVYQIMPFIARQYMKVTPAIDERLDPIKSAAVAARILKHNYDLLGSWPLAITAYNHGPYGIKKAIKKAGSQDIAVLIKTYQDRNFGFASQNFYAEFLAIVHILKFRSDFFPDAKGSVSLDFRNETLTKSMRVRDVSRLFGVSLESFQKLNPDLSPGFLRQNGLLPRHFTVKIPRSRADLSDARPNRVP